MCVLQISLQALYNIITDVTFVILKPLSLTKELKPLKLPAKLISRPSGSII